MIHILMDLLAAILALSGAGSAEEMGEEEMERYRHFAEHPLQINRLPAARLRASGIFTDYQLAALEDYRARNGDILGPTEFALIDGIGPDAAEVLVHFVSFEPAAYSGEGRLRQDLTVRGGVRERGILDTGGGARERGGVQWLAAAKYHAEAGRRAEFFWSSSRPYSADSFVPGTFSLALYGRGGASLVAGDFAARFGQGLALWCGFSMSGFSSVSAFRRNPTGFAPTGSFSPALSGLAGEFSAGRWRFSAGLASPALRAFLAGEGFSGDSGSGGAANGTAGGSAGGGSAGSSAVGGAADDTAGPELIPIAAATYFGRRGRFGVQGVWRGGGVVSADGLLGLGHWTLFGETALSTMVVNENGYGIRRTRLAAVGGAGWAPAYKVQFALLGRYYPSGFYSPLAGAARSFSSFSDKYGVATGESGVSLGARWRWAELTADAALRPSPASASPGTRHFKTILNLAPVFTIDLLKHSAPITPDSSVPAPGGSLSLSDTAVGASRSTRSASGSAGPLVISPTIRWTERCRPADADPWRHELRTDLTLSIPVPSPGSVVLSSSPPDSVILSKAKNLPPATLRASIRADIVRSKGWGKLLYAELGYVSEGCLSAYLRFTAFDIPEWTDRIYCYERDLPGCFTVPAYYRRGQALSAVAGLKLPGASHKRSFRPSARHSVNLRASLVRYPEGPGTPVTEIKLQYRIQL